MAYRYLHEAVEVIADRAPELGQVPAQGPAQGWEFVCLDGTLGRTHALGALYPAATCARTTAPRGIC